MSVLACVSYNWAQKESVSAICSYLVGKNIFSTLQIDYNEQNKDAVPPPRDVGKNMRVTEIVILITSQQYKTSEVCEKEAEIIAAMGKPIFIIRLPPFVEYTLPGGQPAAGQFDFDVSLERPFEVVADKLAESLKRFLADLVLQRDQIESLSSEIKLINVPCFGGNSYLEVPTREQQILDGIESLHVRPLFEMQKVSRILLICGISGVGKTVLLANVLKKHQTFLQRKCGFESIIWVDCSKWNRETFDEDEFTKAICDLMPDLEVDFDEMDDVFVNKKDTRRMLFVLDHISNVNTIDIYLENWPDIPCIALTHDLDTLSRVHQHFDLQTMCSIQYVASLDENTVVNLFSKKYHLKASLEPEKLVELARLSQGLPLGINLIGARFSVRLKDHSLPSPILVYRGLTEDIHCGEYSGSLNHLIEYCLNHEESHFRKAFYAFLLFDPGQVVSVDDLTLLWSRKSNHSTMSRCNNFVFKGLLQNVSGKEKPSFKVHPLVFQATVKNALESRRFAKNIAQLRYRISIGDCCCEIQPKARGRKDKSGEMLAAAFFLKRWDILDCFIEKLNQSDLFDLFTFELPRFHKPLLTYLYAMLAAGALPSYAMCESRKALNLMEHAILRFDRTELKQYLAVVEPDGSQIYSFLKENDSKEVIVIDNVNQC